MSSYIVFVLAFLGRGRVTPEISHVIGGLVLSEVTQTLLIVIAGNRNNYKSICHILDRLFYAI